jgi:hypothetical protein
MKKILFSIFTLCSIYTQQTFAQSYNNPESVEFDYANNRYLIANKGANQILARASDGTLSIFANAPGSPHGIEIVGDTLYCNTGSSLRGFNLNTGTLIFNQTITGASFLNGITHDPAGNLYLTCFSSKKIYRFNTATRQSNIFVNNTTTTPNGIIYDAYDGVNPRLVLAGWGSSATIKSISLADSSISLLLNTPFTNIDGIAKGKNGNFYISCWSNNSIQRYDSTFTGPATAMVTSGLTSPADIFYNQLSDTLAVPFNNNVNFYYFGTLTNAHDSYSKFDNINIFPNPACESINIELPYSVDDIITFDLFEASEGKLIYAAQPQIKGSNYSIDLREKQIAKGIYLLEIRSKKGMHVTKKIVVE